MAETNKSKMMSEAEIIEAINADTLVSVSLGEGQPQKNVKLSTLASVVAGVINTDSTLKNKTLSSFQGDKATGSCDDLLTGGMYYVTSNVTNKPSGVNENGLVLTLGTLSNYRFQIFTPALSLDVYMRKFIFSAWTTWVKLT